MLKGNYDKNFNSLRLFMVILITWNLFGIVGIVAIKFLGELGIIRWEPEYPMLPTALLWQAIFVVGIYVFYRIFMFLQKDRDRPEIKIAIVNVSEAKIFLYIIIITNIIILLKNGIVLLAGDYQARFEMDASSVEKLYIPHIFWGLFFLNIFNSGIGFKRIISLFKWELFLATALSVLISTRGFAFLVIFSLLYIYIIRSKVKVDYKYTIFRFLPIFFGVYFIGQLVNVIRKHGLSVEPLEILITLNGDSFNEIRSFASLLLNDGIYALDYGAMDFVGEFISKIVPSFFYSLVGLNRLDYWNSGWNQLSPLIWGNNEALYGIRFGLVGDLVIYLGKLSIPVFSLLYAYLFTLSSRYYCLFVLYAIYSIPYGALSFAYIFLIVVADYILAVLKKNL
jgi:hypothetical protein